MHATGVSVKTSFLSIHNQHAGSSATGTTQSNDAIPHVLAGTQIEELEEHASFGFRGVDPNAFNIQRDPNLPRIRSWVSALLQNIIFFA